MDNLWDRTASKKVVINFWKYTYSVYLKNKDLFGAIYVFS